ncbi:MAG: hypothetical protein ACFCVD_19285, partial [Nodosilinea sp.]
RHFCLSCLAQSLLHQAPLAGKTSERFSWADDAQPNLGQHRYGLAREALAPLLQWQSVAEVLEVLMPA